MSYLDLLEEEGISANYLIIMRPSRRVTTWTLSSGSVYYNDFNFGYVYGVSITGTALTLGSSTSLSAGQYYYDHDIGRLYIRKSDSTAPDSTNFIISTYELYVGTFDAHWHRIPTDSSTSVVYFDPVVSDVPEIKSAITDLLFGLLPTQSTGITLVNAEHWAEKHIYDSSFLNKEILIYHWLDDLEVANVQLVSRGRMSDVSYSSGSVSVKIFDDTNIFDKEFRCSGATQFYNTTDFSNVDPQFIGKPVRTVYGVVSGFVPVNISFVRDNPSTSNNRTWAVRDGTVNAITRTVPASPACTTTRTYVDDATGFKVGDSVWIDKTTDEYVFVTAVDYASNYIEHLALVSGAAASTNTVKRGTLGNVEIIQQQKRYRAHYNRDWTESISGSVMTFTFSSSLETSLSMAETLSSSDQVFCRVYGKSNTVTLSGGALGADSTNYGNLCNIGVILFDVLKTYQGLAESQINLPSFTSLVSLVTDEIGFAVPDKSQDKYPKLKELLVSILKSSFLRLYLDFDMKWKVSQYTPISSTTKTITEDEILLGSIDYDFDYSDIYSDYVVNYAAAELNESGKAAALTVKTTSSLAKYLHGINRTFDIDTLHIDAAGGATSLANRFSYVLGDRQGAMSLSTKNRFFENIVGDNITVTLTKLPGNTYNGESEFSREFQVHKIDKSLRRVNILLQDQKGAEDNSGSW